MSNFAAKFHQMVNERVQPKTTVEEFYPSINPAVTAAVKSFFGQLEQGNVLVSNVFQAEKSEDGQNTTTGLVTIGIDTPGKMRHIVKFNVTVSSDTRANNPDHDKAKVVITRDDNENVRFSCSSVNVDHKGQLVLGDASAWQGEQRGMVPNICQLASLGEFVLNAVKMTMEKPQPKHIKRTVQRPAPEKKQG